MQPGVPSAAGPQGEGRFRFDFFRPGNKPPPLEFPEDIEVEIFADNVPRGRHMAFDDRGVLFLSQTRKGKVVALPDLDGDGRADRVLPSPRWETTSPSISPKSTR